MNDTEKSTMYEQTLELIKDDNFSLAVQSLTQEERLKVVEFFKENRETISSNEKLLEIFNVVFDTLRQNPFSSILQKQIMHILPRAYKVMKKQNPKMSDIIQEPFIKKMVLMLIDFKVFERIKETIKGDFYND